jgi:hypothetical protein
VERKTVNVQVGQPERRPEKLVIASSDDYTGRLGSMVRRNEVCNQGRRCHDYGPVVTLL